MIHRFDAYEAPPAQPQPNPGMEQLMGAMTALMQTMQGFVQVIATKAPERRPPSGRRKGIVMFTEKLTVITTALNGITTRSVEHPEHGPLILAADLVRGLGYASTGTSTTLQKAGVTAGECILIPDSNLSQGEITQGRIYSRANFLTRKGVNLVLMFSGKPIAQETRQWLAGDVMPAIADTGGYLLNEAARETVRLPRCLLPAV